MEPRRAPGPVAWARAHPLAADGLLAVLLAVVSLIALVFQARIEHMPPPGPLAVAFVLLLSLPLAWRRRHPLGVNLAVGALSAVYGAAPLPDLVTPVPLGGVVAMYTLVAWCDFRTAVIVGVVTGISVVTVAWLPETNTDLLDFSFTTLLLAGAWVLGYSAQIRRAYTAELEARAALLARERDFEARRAVTAERARIARELHDVIAHHVSMMVVQAEAGPVAAERDPPRAVRAFATIADIGREALVEMRRLLGVLRSETGELGVNLAPQPGVAQLPILVEQTREAGLEVELTVEGEPVSLPGGVDLSAYRIVQEALTNAVKHSGQWRARVLVSYGVQDLRIEVRNDGRDAKAGAGGDGKPGYGLIGMRERVNLFGGELTAGPDQHGGFTVAARLPTGGALGGAT
jgi:signal transduction histidine kinase